MTTALFIITSNNKTPQSINRRHIVFPCTGVDSSQLTQGWSKVRRPCQSTIVGAACAELRHSDRTLRTAWFEKGDFKIGIKKKKHWVDFYHYRMDVYTLPTHIYVQTTCKVNFASDDPFKPTPARLHSSAAVFECNAHIPKFNQQWADRTECLSYICCTHNICHKRSAATSVSTQL